MTPSPKRLFSLSTVEDKAFACMNEEVFRENEVIAGVRQGRYPPARFSAVGGNAERTCLSCATSTFASASMTAADVCCVFVLRFAAAATLRAKGTGTAVGHLALPGRARSMT